MQVEIIKCLKDNYSYLVIDEKNKLACVIVEDSVTGSGPQWYQSNSYRRFR